MRRLGQAWGRQSHGLRTLREEGIDSAFVLQQFQSALQRTQGDGGFQLPISVDKALSVLEHIAEGCGIRTTGRLVRVNRGTVDRLAKLAGDQSRLLHDELVAFSPSDARSADGRKVVFCREKTGQLRRR